MKRNSQENRIEYLEDDVDYAVAIIRWLLKFLGMYPVRGYKKTWQRIAAYILGTINIVLMILGLSSMMARVYIDTISGEADALLNAAAAVNFYILAILKFWMMVIRREEVIISFDKLTEDWKRIDCEADWQIMKKSAKMGRNFTILCLTLIYGGSLPYNIVLPLVARSAERTKNSTFRTLPLKAYYGPINDQASPENEILFVVQVFTSIVVVSVNCGIYCFTSVCVMHACGQFQIVGKLLKCLVNEEDVFAMRKLVTSIVQQHERAFGYAENIEKALNVVFLLDMIGCTVTLCFLEYYFMKCLEHRETWGSITYLILVLSLFFNIYILSYIGQQLKDQSQEVGIATYVIEWYRLPQQIVENLIFVMVRSNRPARITAGKLFDLSYESFVDAIKTSFAYLNFLRTVVI